MKTVKKKHVVFFYVFRVALLGLAFFDMGSGSHEETKR